MRGGRALTSPIARDMHDPDTPDSPRVRTLAPACMVAIAYVDPGNFGVNVAAGADHGYALVWVVVSASLIAALVQYLAAKLGVATGLSLAENCRQQFGALMWVFLWLLAELVVIMTDLAELVGGAIALNLLFGLPLMIGAVIVALFSFVVLAMHVRGRDGWEPVVLTLLGIIVASLLYQTVMAGVDVDALLAGTTPGRLDGSGILLAVGIIGATVMPHALHFHSAVSRSSPHLPLRERNSLAGLARLSKPLSSIASQSTRRSVIVAMTLAGLANVSIVVISARLPAGAADALPLAYGHFARVVGRLAAVLFAVALLASGLASTVVGVYSGQIVMEGFLRRSVSLWLRRLVVSIPPLGLLALGLNATQALVMSQVILSFALPGSLIPLVSFTARRSVMGEMVNRRTTSLLAIAATSVIIGLDGYLLKFTFS